MKPSPLPRREFLRRSAALSTAGLAGAIDFFPLMAHAQASDYKALVCVFLFGGMDGNNVLVPIDTAGYGAYAAVRRFRSSRRPPASRCTPRAQHQVRLPFRQPVASDYRASERVPPQRRD